jgi:hypothetical protein
MGQIFGLGFSGGEKQKSQTTVNIPPELRQMYRQQTQLAEGGMPQYQDLLRRALGGDRGVADPYTGSLASTYMPLAGTYQSQEASFLPGKEAYTAPYAAQIQAAQNQIRRAMPAGGGQQAALAQATMQGGLGMGQARAQQAQRDIDARNALRQQDIQTQMRLGGQDIQTQMALAGADVQARNQMMQKLLSYYSGIFGGFNPQAQAGSTQTQGTGGRLGLPFADIGL